MSRDVALFSRRDLIGVGAAAAAAPGLLGARFAPQDAPIDPELLALLPNLSTRLAVRVWLDGRGPYLFVVDTGANRTTLAAEVADALGLARGRTVLVHGVTAAEPAPTVRPGNLRVVGVDHRGLETPVIARDRLRADGLLGLDVLSGFRLIFDMAAGTLSMGRVATEVRIGERGSRVQYDSSLRARRRRGQLLFEGVRVDAERAVAFIDSGSQYTIGNRALLNAVRVRRPDLTARGPGVPIIGVTGQRRMGEVAVVDSLRLGGAVLRRTPIVFADLHAFDYLGLSQTPALVLGADVMGRLSQVTVDFARSRVGFGRALT